MGLFGDWRLARAVANLDLDAVPESLPSTGVGRRAGVRIPGNPFQLGTLNPLVWNDLFDGYGLTVDRDRAMTIPGVARGRGVILSLIADKPLVDYAEPSTTQPRGGRATIQPTWLYRVPGWQGPWRRMALTLDDHIFYEASLWGCRRGAAGAGGGLKPILDAWHIPYDAWRVNDGGVIEVIHPETGQFVKADEDEVIYLPGPSDGLCAHAARTLAGSADLESAWIKRAKNPIPMLDLHETQETNLEHDERQEVVDDWAQARHDPNGAIASTPFNIDARVLGNYEADMFIGARNAARLDIANFLQIPASVMDASTATASLTYTTQEGDQSSLSVMTVPYWCRPIEDRLSQDDVVPRGHIVRFSFAEAYTEPPGPIMLAPNVRTAAGVIRDTAAVTGGTAELGAVVDALDPEGADQ